MEAVAGDAPVVIPPLRILLVEDVELNITVARALLEKLGHQVAVAMTGAEALSLAQPGRFDLILLDIQLPDMSGFEIADRLRAAQGEALPPLVALTANLIRDKSEYQRHGMVEVIGKPLAVESLAQCLERLFVVCPTPERQEEPGRNNFV